MANVPFTTTTTNTTNTTNTAAAAVPIVSPVETSGYSVVGKTAKPIKANINKRLCRNVIIHGFCKYQEKGCEFNHHSMQEYPESSKPKLSNPSSVTRPTTMMSAVSADSINAPVFIPKSALGMENAVSTAEEDPPLEEAEGEDPLIEEYSSMTHLTREYSHFSIGEPEQQDPYYYMTPPLYQRQPLQHHFYSPSLTRTMKLASHQKLIQSLFMPDHLREQLTERNEKVLTTGTTRDHTLPQQVHVYQCLSLLDETDRPGMFFGHPSWVYKAVCSVDRRSYVLMRIQGFRLGNELAMTTMENWRRIRHCNVTAVREVFATTAFGDASLIFVYDYYPSSETLYQKHFALDSHSTSQHIRIREGSVQPIPESVLWNYITQIVSALKSMHTVGLAARTIEPRKLLVTGTHRLRINFVCVLDILQFDGGQNVSRHQQEDLLAFGKTMLVLACQSIHAVQNLAQSFEFITKVYSPDLKNTILYLLSQPMPTKTIDEVVSLIAPHILQQINRNQSHNDTLENVLGRELENARLVQLVSKMAFINERPEFDMDPSWSETGDRYIIKLFRDYVFHQVDTKQKPVIDMIHVLTCLNKLEAGIDEKIMLMSRDEQSCLVVSYKEVKNCILSAYNDLTSGRK
ncbi:hypothetical protein BDF14DRAFT_1779057 [Spinellus fusiger]|nr:hypothetical protein BDF14DRAFT_1779057 [Spinellus fusiger]